MGFMDLVHNPASRVHGIGIRSRPFHLRSRARILCNRRSMDQSKLGRWLLDGWSSPLAVDGWRSGQQCAQPSAVAR
jgi:hypothetical protein